MGRDPGEGKLHDAGDRHGPGKGQPHVPAGTLGHQHGRDEHQVHQHRHEAGLGEPPEGIEHARQHRNQRDEQDVGKGNPPEQHGQIEPGIADKAAGHRPDQRGHGDGADNREHDQHAGKRVEGIAGKGLRILARFQLFAEHRHEGHVEGPFCKEAAKHVGQRKGDEKGLGHRPGTQIGRHHHIAQEPDQPADKGPAAHGQKAPHQADGLHATPVPAGGGTGAARSAYRRKGGTRASTQRPFHAFGDGLPQLALQRLLP